MSKRVYVVGHCAADHDHDGGEWIYMQGGK